ncbi:type II toxin-antitoxin system RelE/ParE family toxin [Spongiibacter sp. KMU-158]|uniref:Type II toxin-antitoxin system RelE/ParE family toxin n=1 Tax=Spongiibacter pelagi TaxID=2760804 RepID=A0A927C1C3_9GAMM|nr:type II toxin-antitoxin system RelE/ParE family toxin [Spongiibacter pelagi]MBD2858072.1 type II toxin-antitoxin system RelE/ParE family toxin [Spongiibacter pelagi]
MSGEQPSASEVYETSRFTKALNKLDKKTQADIEDAIEEIIANPLIGEQKKGALKYLRVHKTKSGPTEYLLGYNWDEGRLTIHLLQVGPHENYYRDAESRRKSDLKFISE